MTSGETTMRSLVCWAVGLLVLVPLTARAEGKKAEKKGTGVLNFTMKSLDGKEVDLSKYKGKVVLLVNVASFCGNTPQYKGLEALYRKYKDDGLVVIGVPANEFGKQEPGTDEQIAKFCKSKYDVTFPMMSKQVVKGEGICPLYKYLTSKESDPEFAGAIEWNFAKFLISRDGKVVNRFKPKAKPESKAIVSAIEKQLKQK
jgi:glutathione peroxidase